MLGIVPELVGASFVLVVVTVIIWLSDNDPSEAVTFTLTDPTKSVFPETFSNSLFVYRNRLPHI